MTQCIKTGKYYDSKDKTEKSFECNENALGSEYCIFHKEDYLNDDTSNLVQQKFIEKVDQAISKSQPLVCVGYILPAINLSNKIFEYPVYFNSTIFQNTVKFSKVVFKNDVIFEKTIFQRSTSFVKTNFLTLVKFSECIFEKDVNFPSGVFNEVIFKSNKFQDSLFSLSIFHKSNFIGNNFNGKSDFSYCEFNNETVFQSNSFGNISNFSQSRHKQESRFIKNNFLTQLNFREIHFQNNSEIFFDWDLSTVSFYETDISKIIFGTNVSWDIKYEKGTNIFQNIKILFNKFKNINNKFKIQDEKILEQGIENNISLESVLDEYRKLRERFDKQLRYDIAGEFFIREHEVNRKFKKNLSKQRGINQPLAKQKDIIKRIFSIPAIYYFIGRYGESYHRPIEIAIPGLIFSTLYFWSLGFSNFDLIYNDDMWVKSLKSSILRSISGFFPFFGFESNYSTSDLLLRMILLPISGTLFIALRRKLERKYR